MSAGYPRSAQNRRSAKMRDPVELRVVKLATVISIALICITVIDSPLTGPWNSPVIRAFLTGLSLGLVVPANFTYVLIFTFVFAVLTAFIWRWALRSIRTRTAAGKTLEELKGLSPDQFEEWVAARFEDLGYSVRVTGMQADHGVDLLAEKPETIAAIQCKNYRSSTVGEPVLRDLLGAMQHYGADRGYLVTTGHLTEAAVDWARGKSIEAWDGDHIARLSMKMERATSRSQHHEPRLAPSASLPPTQRVEGSSESDQDLTSSSAITCPQCGTSLVVRRNRETGELFLGCSRYPHCRFTQPLPVGRASSTERPRGDRT